MIDQRPPDRVGDDLDALSSAVRSVTERVAQRLIEEIEHEDAHRIDRSIVTLATDHRRQQLRIGSWIVDEIAAVNEQRLQRGDRPLTTTSEHRLRARVAAELTGAGPLEPYMG